MPLQIMKYSLQINNLIYLCFYLSRQHAILLVKKKGITVDTYQDHISIEKHRKIMKYAMAAGFVFDDFDKQHIEDYSVVRVYKEAPVLYQLINHIDKSFQVAMRPQPINCNHGPSHLIHILTSYSPSSSFPAIVKKAFYFMTSPLIWTVNPDSKKFFVREGYNLGLGNLKESSVSLNLEFVFNSETLIHEIIHLKHSDWSEEIVSEAAAMVLKDCPLFTKKVEGLKPKLNLEFNRIVRDFMRFDFKVGQILEINKNQAQVRQVAPGDRLKAPGQV
jgi:hypothetical protein